MTLKRFLIALCTLLALHLHSQELPIHTVYENPEIEKEETKNNLAIGAGAVTIFIIVLAVRKRRRKRKKKVDK